MAEEATPEPTSSDAVVTAASAAAAIAAAAAAATAAAVPEATGEASKGACRVSAPFHTSRCEKSCHADIGLEFGRNGHGHASRHGQIGTACVL